MNTKFLYQGANMRLDVFLTEKLNSLTRSYIKKMIKEGNILVNGKQEKPGYKLQNEDLIEVLIIEEKPKIEAEQIPLNIVYEDSDILVIDKPSGMVVHPAKGHYTGTVVNALLNYPGIDSLSLIPGEERPGIVHRIDKDTSGLLVIAKTDKACKQLIEDFSKHNIKRVYTAYAWGTFEKKEDVISTNIGRDASNRLKMAVTKNGKEAITKYKVETQYKKGAHIICELFTGRTHQIRVHMKSIGHPLIGDKVYGNGRTEIVKTGQALHAGLLGFNHPTTGEYMEFKSEEPTNCIYIISQIL